MSFHKLACGTNYLIVYRHTMRGTIFTSLIQIVRSLCFANFYGLMVYFTTFGSIVNIFTYSNDWGGGGYVVKTYPSIDPIAAPRYN